MLKQGLYPVAIIITINNAYIVVWLDGVNINVDLRYSLNTVIR